MSSSIFRFIPSLTAAASCLRRPMSLYQNRGCSTKLSDFYDSSHRRVSSPWLMLPPSYEKEGRGGGMSYNFYSLAENKVVSLKKNSKHESESPNDDAEIVGSSHGWLALYNRGDRGLFLSNPITGENIKLPPIDTLDTYHVSIFTDEEKYCIVKRVILSSPPHQQDCRAIIFFGYRRNLAVCSPGRSSAWTEIYCGLSTHDDVVYSTTDGLFFGLLEKDATTYDVEAWDCTDPSDPKDVDEGTVYFSHLHPDHEEDPSYGPTDREKELVKLYGSWPRQHFVYVEHTDQLLLVKRHIVEHMALDGSPIKDRENRLVYPHKTVVFDVYTIETNTCTGRLGRLGRLQYMEDSLDGLVLFVGINHSLAVRASEFPELKPDSIYFTEDKPFGWPMLCPDYVYGGHDIGIFDYKNKTISPCYYPCDHGSFKKIYPSPLWITPSPH